MVDILREVGWKPLPILLGKIFCGFGDNLKDGATVSWSFCGRLEWRRLIWLSRFDSVTSLEAQVLEDGDGLMGVCGVVGRDASGFEDERAGGEFAVVDDDGPLGELPEPAEAASGGEDFRSSEFSWISQVKRPFGRGEWVEFIIHILLFTVNLAQ